MSGGDRVNAPDDKKNDDGNRVNMLQVAAATGASTTAAIVATLLGVYGTVIGVGVISLVSSITTVLYVRSINSTKDKIRKVNMRAARPSRESVTEPAPGSTATTAIYSTMDPGATKPMIRPAESEPGPTEVLPAANTSAGTTARGQVSVPDAMTEAAAKPDTDAAESQEPWWREKMQLLAKNWRPILITTGVVFALSIVALTSIALLSGKDANAFYRATAPDSSTSQTPQDDEHSSDYDEETGPSEPQESETDSPSQTPSDDQSPAPEPTEPQEPSEPTQPSQDEPTEPNAPTPGGPGGNDSDVTP